MSAMPPMPRVKKLWDNGSPAVRQPTSPWVFRRRQGWPVLLVIILLIDLIAALIWVAVAILAIPDGRNGAAIGILWGDASQLGRETMQRVRHAHALWLAGPASRTVICVGGRRVAANFNGAERACDMLRRMGVPTDRLEIGKGSNDTPSNLRDLAEVAKRRGVPSVTVVAGPIQALRAKAMLDHHGVVLHWSSYPIRKVPPAKLWLMVHHEWLALATMTLPQGLRVRLLYLIRA